MIAVNARNPRSIRLARAVLTAIISLHLAIAPAWSLAVLVHAHGDLEAHAHAHVGIGSGPEADARLSGGGWHDHDHGGDHDGDGEEARLPDNPELPSVEDEAFRVLLVIGSPAPSACVPTQSMFDAFIPWIAPVVIRTERHGLLPRAFRLTSPLADARCIDTFEALLTSSHAILI